MKSQRDAFFDELYKIALKDDRVVVVTADCGAPSLDQWKNLPDQFINVGIAENNMIAIASGLAISGKRPFCYAIATFATLKCYEAIKSTICCMNLPVTIVGLGVGYSYWDSGPTHHALEDIAVMRVLPNMQIASPHDTKTAKQVARIYEKPTYIRLDKESGVYAPHIFFLGKNALVRKWYPLWLKPFSMPLMDGITQIVTVEEHLNGGLGSIVAELLANTNIKVTCIRVKDYHYIYGGRENLRKEIDNELQTLLAKHDQEN